MTANIQRSGLDLDSVYAAHVTNSAAHLTNYQVSGTDIQTRYDPLSAPAQANFGSRIPAIGITTSATGWTANTDLSSIFAGNPGQYSITSAGSSGEAITSPNTYNNNIIIVFNSPAALTSYFLYGGRIIVTASQGVGTAADADLQAMFTQIGSLVVYDTGSYITGAGGGVTMNNSVTGGSNVTSTSVLLMTATELTTYTSNSFTISMVLTNSTTITITTKLTLVQHGTVADSYTGTYTTSAQQRNYSGIVAPTQLPPTVHFA